MISARDRFTGASTQVATQVSINFGASLAATVLPVVGAPVVVAARQVVTAVVLLPFYRPRRADFAWRNLWPAIALGVILAVMNLTFYGAIARLGLGTAATLEFLGPLAVALLASRRLLDAGCAALAAAGVVMLTFSGGTVDPIGIVFALIAAAAWAGYILLTRTVATRLRGLSGLTVASIVSTIILLPVALMVVQWSALSWPVLGILVAAGLLASAIPYSLDTFILRRITPRLYAVITSTSPVIAAGFGALILGETYTGVQQLGIVAVFRGIGRIRRDDPRLSGARHPGRPRSRSSR